MAQDTGALLTAGRRDSSRTGPPQCYDSRGQATCEAYKSSYGCVPQYPGDYQAWEVATLCRKTCGACNHMMYRAEEADVLNELYKATSGAAWTHSDGWGTNVTACWWFGVACDADGFVTVL